MEEGQKDDTFNKWKTFLDILFGVGMLFILGSCVVEINDVGGGHRSAQKAGGIFFFHLLFVFPCLVGLFIYLQLFLERRFLSKETIDHMNVAQKKYARAELKRKLGPLYGLFAVFIKPDDKK